MQENLHLHIEYGYHYTLHVIRITSQRRVLCYVDKVMCISAINNQ